MKPESLKTIVMLKEYKTDNKEVNIVSFEEFKNTGDTSDVNNKPPTPSGKSHLSISRFLNIIRHGDN